MNAFGHHALEPFLELQHAVICTKMGYHDHIIKFLVGVFRGEAWGEIVVRDLGTGIELTLDDVDSETSTGSFFVFFLHVLACFSHGVDDLIE